MTNDLIALEVQAGIATLTFNRPDKRNAMNDEMRTQFIEALESVAADKTIRALVITGAGKGFCAGGDNALFSTTHRQCPSPPVKRISARVRHPALALAVAGIVAAAVLHLVATPSLFRWLMPLPDARPIWVSHAGNPEKKDLFIPRVPSREHLSGPNAAWLGSSLSAHTVRQ
jgi:hypothetical protein